MQTVITTLHPEHLIGVGVLVGGLTAVAEEAPDIIANAGTDDAPAADLLALNISAPITWPDSKAFRLTSAGISDSLQLAGELWDT